MKKVLGALVLSVVMAVAGCGGGGSSTPTPQSDGIVSEGTSASPISLTIGVSHGGSVATDSASYYSFNTTSAGSYTITMSNLSVTSGEVSWQLYRGSTSVGICSEAGSSTITCQTTLLASTTYTIISMNASSSGATYNLEVSALEVPAAPTNVVATPGTDQVTISWQTVSGATSYKLYWSTSPGIVPGGPGVQDYAVAGSPFTKTSLTTGTEYYFAVSAVNSAGESAISAEVSATPL